MAVELGVLELAGAGVVEDRQVALDDVYKHIAHVLISVVGFCTPVDLSSCLCDLVLDNNFCFHCGCSGTLI